MGVNSHDSDFSNEIVDFNDGEIVHQILDGQCIDCGETLSWLKSGMGYLQSRNEQDYFRDFGFTHDEYDSFSLDE